ncbi:Ogt [Symbiodinium natans]|uniref:Ogt protein n=1 Tax=Symbiodinium natans TaxID=878477 RepID=A0A812U3Q8_9DINO|nr:Ogt [Symbiodinium natans]
MSKDAKTAADLRREGRSKLFGGDHSGAAKLLREAARREPEDAGGHYLLGVACCRLGELREAEASLKEAIRLQPKEPAYHANLGWLYGTELKNYAAAVEAYREALRLEPGNKDSRRELAEVERKLQEARKGRRV